jgi:putative FmdB family regulatory protein
MPIYEYACSACGHQFEALIRSDTVPQCPQCHSDQLDKQLSVFATTASSTTPLSEMPNPCGSCCSPDGPGACAFRDQG